MNISYQLIRTGTYVLQPTRFALPSWINLSHFYRLNDREIVFILISLFHSRSDLNLNLKEHTLEKRSCLPFYSQKAKLIRKGVTICNYGTKLQNKYKSLTHGNLLYAIIPQQLPGIYLAIFKAWNTRAYKHTAIYSTN